MLLKELIRFSTQHRTFYCYIILSIWIFLLIFWYVNVNSLGNPLSFFNIKTSGDGISANVAVNSENNFETMKLNEFKERCTPFQKLQRREDGGILENFKLQGVLLVIRHGDRGSMSHIRGVEKIDCGVNSSDPLVNRYRSFLYNSTSSSGSNHMYWNKVGPFHGFALLPATDKICFLGQLTYKGLAQLLHLGEVLHQIYAHPLGLLYRQTSTQINATPHSLLNSDEVVLFSTRYRRTFQSAMAFLYAFLPADKFLALNVKESHSMSFCFADCACPRAEELRKQIISNSKNLVHHSSVNNVMQWIGSTLLQYTPNGIGEVTSADVMDAMLTVLCHDAAWPCRRFGGNNSSLTTPSSSSSSLNVDLNDVINIDQDENSISMIGAGNDLQMNAAENMAEPPTASTLGSNERCIEPAHVIAFMNYINWESKREAHNLNYKRIGLMRAYGMIRHIVSFMLRMISGDRTKFVLYSGHDFTLQYLTAALGIQVENTFIQYAARLSFEIYKSHKSETHADYYFRVVYNGYDVTRQIDFCEGGKSLRVTRDFRGRGNKADLCPIENIIRFLHEDYFGPLNATNFKDACYVTTTKANGL